jgi:N-acetylmuramate 1-kinase
MFERHFVFSSQIHTENFAEMLSLWARPGQLLALSGDLGSGKSTFARAFIKALASPQDVFDIPSPSFSLVQTYDNTRIPVAHIDLYRLSDESQTTELGIAELLDHHIALVEWPHLLPQTLKAAMLHLHFSGQGQQRNVSLKADATWQSILTRNNQIESFLSTTAWADEKRLFLEGDASSRRYETISLNNVSSILMDMPQKPDGPPVKNGKPYSAIAHLAEGISAVVAVNRHLLAANYSAPKIEAVDMDAGLAIIENLGGQVFGRMIKSGADMAEPMQTAIALLADIATKEWPAEVKLTATQNHKIPAYDIEAQLIEADLLVSWFWPYIYGEKPPEDLHHSFAAVWRDILRLANAEKPVWVLRDYHSPNLIWIPNRKGMQRIGLIDTQDCLLGHPAYDLASLLQDARTDIDFKDADELYSQYENLRSAQNSNFNKADFSAAYCVLGAQRATKILGIFARLAKRDGKPAYLQHMPRVKRYLKRNLQHQALHPLLHWYEKNMPEALQI